MKAHASWAKPDLAHVAVVEHWPVLYAKIFFAVLALIPAFRRREKV